MNKKFLKQQEALLKEKKEKLESQLNSFAQKSESGSDWSAKMPLFDTSGKTSLEEEADEVEEFDTRLALERSLESQLKDVSLALKMIKKGEYGFCEKCKGKIRTGRLKAYPQARYCTKCQ